MDLIWISPKSGDDVWKKNSFVLLLNDTLYIIYLFVLLIFCLEVTLPVFATSFLNSAGKMSGFTPIILHSCIPHLNLYNLLDSKLLC